MERPKLRYEGPEEIEVFFKLTNHEYITLILHYKISLLWIVNEMGFEYTFFKALNQSLSQ